MNTVVPVEIQEQIQELSEFHRCEVQVLKVEEKDTKFSYVNKVYYQVQNILGIITLDTFKKSGIKTISKDSLIVGDLMKLLELTTLTKK